MVVIAASMEGVGRLEGYEGDAARDFLGIGAEVRAIGRVCCLDPNLNFGVCVLCDLVV